MQRPLTSSEFRDGPTKHRRPTDWICGLLFVGMWIAIGIIGLVYGNNATKHVDRPRDYDHNVCDQDYPLLYVASFDVSRTVCVQDCPSEMGIIIRCKKNSVFRFCPVSRSGLIVNNFYNLCHTNGMDIQVHTVKGNASSFAGSIIEAVWEISKTAGVVSMAGLLMTLLTLCFPSVTIWVWSAGLSIGLCLMGGLFLFMYAEGKVPFFAETVLSEQRYVTFMVLGCFCLLAAVVVFVTILLKQNIGKLQPVLILARGLLRFHWQLFLLAILLSGLSFAMMVLLAHLLESTQSNVDMNFLNRGAYNQFTMPKEQSISLIVLLAFAYLWSHGFMVALSSYIGEAFAVQWYFDQKQRQSGQPIQKIALFQVFRQIGMHFGTICFHGSVVYLPEFAGSFICGSAQAVPCCLNYVSIYGLFQTVLCGQHFMIANQESWHLLNRVKARCRDKYMLGHFYVRVAKGFLWTLAILTAAAFMAFDKPYFFGHGLYIVPPLLVTTLMVLEIGTHFSMLLGTIGDTIVISYVADMQMSHEDIESAPRLARAFLAPPPPPAV